MADPASSVGYMETPMGYAGTDGSSIMDTGAGAIFDSGGIDMGSMDSLGDFSDLSSLGDLTDISGIVDMSSMVDMASITEMVDSDTAGGLVGGLLEFFTS